MRVTEQTFKDLQAQGIFIDTFAESKEQFRAKLEKHYTGWLNFYRDQYDTEEEYQAQVQKYVERDINANPMALHGRWYDATTLFIRKGEILCKRTFGKSELVSTEKVLKAVEKEEKAYKGAYGEFALSVNRLVKEKIGSSAFVYPTTYGIGILVFYNWHANENIKVVEDLLKEHRIKYRNEFSDARYVYRFVISKNEVNRIKLKKAV